MIKLNRKTCPAELTEELKKELTECFNTTRTAVWKKPYIEEALLSSSNGKCAYCECKIDRESKYMEVEHFHDKNTYPEDVVNWENLLPSCKRCNGHKSTFDTKSNPFINPYDVYPMENLILNAYRFFPLTLAGKNTIDELILNDFKRLVVQRFEITEAMLSQLEDIYDRASEYKRGSRRTPQNKKKIINSIENLMIEALPDSAYSATVATAMLKDIHFLFIIEFLKSEGFWSIEMNQMLEQISELSLNTDISQSKKFLESFPI